MFFCRCQKVLMGIGWQMVNPPKKKKLKTPNPLWFLFCKFLLLFIQLLRFASLRPATVDNCCCTLSSVPLSLLCPLLTNHYQEEQLQPCLLLLSLFALAHHYRSRCNFCCHCCCRRYYCCRHILRGEL